MLQRKDFSINKPEPFTRKPAGETTFLYNEQVEQDKVVLEEIPFVQGSINNCLFLFSMHYHIVILSQHIRDFHQFTKFD